MKSQASGAPDLESVQSQNRLRQKIESPIKDLRVLHGRLNTNHLMAHHEGVEQAVHLVGDGSALIFWDMCEGDGGHAAVAAVRSHFDLAIDPSFADRRESAGEDPCGGIPAKLGLEDLADPGERHGIDRDDLYRSGGALGRAQASSSPGATVAPGFNCTYPTGNSPA
jgi:hypothetical protein